MTQVTLNIKDSQLKFFMELIAKLDFVSVDKENTSTSEGALLEEEIISELLEKSERDIEERNIHPHDHVMKETRAKYGL